LTALIVSAVFVAWMGEVLVGSVEVASKSLGMTDLFVGLVVVAIAGNAYCSDRRLEQTSRMCCKVAEPI
jgi:calcium/proton exchanger cax